MLDTTASTETAAGAPALEFRNVSICYDDQVALDDVSFRLEQGEMLFVTGASGCGKSQLLRLALGLIPPDSGQIFLGGTEIDHLPERELLQIRKNSIGMVFQEQAAFTSLTVYDNTAYRLKELGWEEVETRSAVTEMLSSVGLADDLDKLPEELSVGMERRLEIARTLIGWPSVMLFDEPTSSLDPVNAEQILTLVLRARDVQKVSTIYVTKLLDEIPYLAERRATLTAEGKVTVAAVDPHSYPQTRVMVLESGRIAFLGDHKSFFASELNAVKYLTHAENGTVLSDKYFADPWDKHRKPAEKVLGADMEQVANSVNED